MRARENQVAEQLGSVERRLEGMEVRAPVTGEVYGMRVFTPGEVVNPGEPILSIVPDDAGLVVLAQLDPIHVDQLYSGQEAVLRFSSFPARSTPEYVGRVTRIGADAQHDPQTGLGWYEVELAVGAALDPTGVLDFRRWLSTLRESVRVWLPARDAASEGTGAPDDAAAAARPPDRELELSPGMPVEVYVRTEDRSPLDYLAKPLTDYFMRSLRED